MRSGGAAQLNDTLVDNNEATGTVVCDSTPVCGSITGGGGIMNSGTLTLNRTQVTGNRSGMTATGCNFSIFGAPSPVPVSSPISGETFCISAVGGGISSDGTLTVVNSSIIGNQAGPGWLLSGFGGGIYTHQGTSRTTLAFTTIAGSGQAVAGSFSTSASILQSGAANGDACAQFHPDMSVSQVTSLDYNVVSDEFCHLRQPHDHQSVDPKLVRLFQAGFDTRIPVAGSPALDAIPSGTPKLCDGTLSVDLRGTPRPSGTGCDIGAVERQPSDP
ncbi:MAG: choice-of-anchor Q domain-containing protein [Acidimicrobiales bacterium]